MCPIPGTRIDEKTSSDVDTPSVTSIEVKYLNEPDIESQTHQIIILINGNQQ